MRTAREVIAEVLREKNAGCDLDACRYREWMCQHDIAYATDAALAALRAEGLVIVAAADVRAVVDMLPKSNGRPITGSAYTSDLICLCDRFDAALAVGGTDGH